jgi:hypothetical protein
MTPVVSVVTVFLDEGRFRADAIDSVDRIERVRRLYGGTPLAGEPGGRPFP